MPAPPPIQMTVPEPDPIATQTRGRAVQLPTMPAPLPEDPPPDPVDDDSAVAHAGPARLYIGPPRAVAPVRVRAGLDGRTDISDVAEVEVPVARSGAAEPRANSEGTEFRFALPRGDRVPARTRGLDQGASTVVATPERRVWVEGDEDAPSREVIRPPSAARPRPGPLEPPLRRPIVSEVIGAPSPPEVRPVTPRVPVPEEHDLPHDHPAAEAPGVNLADDGFYERQGVPSARLPDRALQAPLPAVRSASRKFVPRTPPPRRRVPAWAWAVTGALLVVAGLAGTWSKIQREIERVDSPRDPVADVVIPEETPPGVETPRVPGGEDEPHVDVPPPAEVPTQLEVAPPTAPPAEVPVEIEPPAAKPPVDPPPVTATPPVPPPATPPAESSIVLVGALRVVSNVPGKIYIDGKYKAAVDEEVVLELPAGVHDVKLVPRRGRAQTQKIRVDAGEARGVVFEIR